MSEPTLDAVRPDDKQMIKDVLRVWQGLSYCTTFTINLVSKGYEVLSYLQKGWR